MGDDSTKKRIIRDERGHALLESVISIPVLVFLSAFIIQMSLLFNTKQVVTYAAFCAARAAVSYGNQPKKIIQAARMACTPISSPISAEAQDVLEFVSLDGLADLDLDWLRDVPVLGTVVDVSERFVTSCLRTRLGTVTVTDSKATVEVIYYTKLILPMAGLARLVSGYRWQQYNRVVNFAVPYLPEILTDVINYCEELVEAIMAMAVPISSSCTLEF